MVNSCPQLKRLKIKKCYKLTSQALVQLMLLKNLEHISLLLSVPADNEHVLEFVDSAGPNLKTLSLERFHDIGDGLLNIIHSKCRRLIKLRLSDNDVCTDMAFAALFKDWKNPPLRFIDLANTRSVDYEKPDGDEEMPVGLRSSGFKALMAHSGSNIERLDITSCRHISYEALSQVFDGKKTYPNLREIDLSFVRPVDTVILAGLFRSCPAIKKVTAFACFNIKDVIVPGGVALIGLPAAQESIIQEGTYPPEY